MIDAIIIAIVIIIWDIIRDWVVVPRKTEKRIKKHMDRLEKILLRIESRQMNKKDGNDKC